MSEERFLAYTHVIQSVKIRPIDLKAFQALPKNEYILLPNVKKTFVASYFYDKLLSYVIILQWIHTVQTVCIHHYTYDLHIWKFSA